MDQKVEGTGRFLAETIREVALTAVALIPWLLRAAIVVLVLAGAAAAYRQCGLSFGRDRPAVRAAAAVALAGAALLAIARLIPAIPESWLPVIPAGVLATIVLAAVAREERKREEGRNE